MKQIPLPPSMMQATQVAGGWFLHFTKEGFREKYTFRSPAITEYL